MNIKLNLLELKKVAKDKLVGSVFSDFLVQVVHHFQFDNGRHKIDCSVNLSVDLDKKMQYLYYKDLKTGKKYDYTEHHERVNNVYSQYGNEGSTAFLKKNVQEYNSEVYESVIEYGKKIAMKLKKLGLNAKVKYDKKYKKASVDSPPDDVWIEIFF